MVVNRLINKRARRSSNFVSINSVLTALSSNAVCCSSYSVSDTSAIFLSRCSRRSRRAMLKSAFVVARLVLVSDSSVRTLRRVSRVEVCSFFTSVSPCRQSMRNRLVESCAVSFS